VGDGEALGGGDGDGGGTDDVDVGDGGVPDALLTGETGDPAEPPVPQAIPPPPSAIASAIHAMPRLPLMTTAILEPWGNAGRTFEQRSGYGFR
jgi:hypothetical protein